MIVPASSAAMRRTVSQAHSEQAPEPRMTSSGWWLVVCALLISLSVFKQFRVEVGGLQVHPINLVVPIVLLGGLQRLRSVPSHVVTAGVFFLLVFAIAALTQSGGTSVTFKVGAALVTVLAAAVAVRTEADFRFGAFALLVSVTIISIRGLMIGDSDSLEGINPMVGIGNKNGFSVYVLPGLLLGGHLLLSHARGLQRLIIIGGILVTTFALFSTGNRSGWLCAILIAVALGLRSLGRARSFLLIAAVIVGAVLLVDKLGNTQIIEVRRERTGTYSDQYRLWIVERSFEIGLENPVLGVSPQKLPNAVARRSPDGFAAAPHNVFALIFGGGGFTLAIAFLFLGLSMWVRPRWGAAAEPGEARTAHYLLRSMLLLWCLRGLFTEEILYNPSFSFGIGMCLGLCSLRGVWSLR